MKCDILWFLPYRCIFKSEMHIFRRIALNVIYDFHFKNSGDIQCQLSCSSFEFANVHLIFYNFIKSLHMMYAKIVSIGGTHLT